LLSHVRKSSALRDLEITFLRSLMSCKNDVVSSVMEVFVRIEE